MEIEGAAVAAAGNICLLRVGGSGVGSSLAINLAGGGGDCIACLNVTTSSSSSTVEVACPLRAGVANPTLRGIGAIKEGGEAAGAVDLEEVDAGEERVFGDTFLPH